MFENLKTINQSNVEQSERKADKAQRKLADIQTQEVFVKSIQALAEFMEGHTSKTVVLNQLRDYATGQDITLLSQAIDSLHDTLKTHENTDLSPVVDVLNKAVIQLEQVPKDHKDIVIPEQKDYSDQLSKFIELAGAIKESIDAQETTVEAPVVNVEAPNVQVDAPDLKPLAKELDKAFTKAIKGIKQPKPADLSPVTKEQSKTTKAVDKLRKVMEDMPLGGGSGSSSSIAPFLDDNGALPTVGLSLDLQVDDTGTYTYLGNAIPGTATSESSWRIKRVTNATGVITHADGASTFTKEWDERSSYTY